MYTIYWSGSAVSNDLYSVHITAKYGVWFDHFLFLFMWFQLNKVIVSDDCTSTRKCVRRDGESVFEDLGVNERCHPSGMCGLKDGVRQCVCKDGYIGDGVNECKSKYSLLLISVSDIIKVRIRYILSHFFQNCVVGNIFVTRTLDVTMVSASATEVCLAMEWPHAKVISQNMFFSVWFLIVTQSIKNFNIDTITFSPSVPQSLVRAWQAVIPITVPLTARWSTLWENANTLCPSLIPRTNVHSMWRSKTSNGTKTLKFPSHD